MNKEKVYGYLSAYCIGRKHVTSSQTLEKMLNLSGNELRKQVNALRREGIPIASNSEGYFYAENAAEIYATIRSLHKMRRGLDSAIEGLEKAMEKFGGSP